MATLTIRNVPEDVKRELRIAAAKRGVSMEQEARDRLSTPPTETLAVGPKASAVDIVRKYGRRPDVPFDLKDVSDALWDDGGQ